MKKIGKAIGSIIVIAGAIAFSASNTQGQNLLVNPNFDTSQFTTNPIEPGGQNQGWALFGLVAQTNMFGSPVDSPLSNPYALIEQNAPGNNWNPVGAYQITDGIAEGGSIVAGQQYTFSIWDITDTGTTYATPVDLDLSFTDSSVTNNLGVASQSANNNGFHAANGSPVANNANGWVQYSVTAVAPAGAKYALVYAMFMDNAQLTTENVYFDNASILIVPEPSSLALMTIGLVIPFFIRLRKSV